MNIFIHQNW